MNANGSITVRIDFYDLFVDGNGESELLDAIFPEGWEGELTVTSSDYKISEED